jgi:serine/threonine-protein kinase HipA
MALPIRGKKRNLSKNDLLKYFCQERCGIPSKSLDQMMEKSTASIPVFLELIGRSFLSPDRQNAYCETMLAEPSGWD